MIDRHLDLQNRLAVLDFIDENVGYLPATARKPYAQIVEDVEDGKKITDERLADVGKNLAVATWAARTALRTHLDGAGAKEEWVALIDAVRPTTKLLLTRLHKNAPEENVDTVLKSADASIAFHAEEETEIDLLRSEIRVGLWEKLQKPLAKSVAAKEAEFEAMRQRLKRLREYANVPSRIQDQLRAKVDTLEDRVYFGGESIPIESLDAELRFDAADIEIPPLDDALNGAEVLPPIFEAVEQEQERQGERDTEEQRQSGS
jgi:hypothetical protein